MSDIASPRLALPGSPHRGLSTALAPGTFVVVRAQPTTPWLACVLDRPQTAVENAHPTTLVTVIDPLGVPGLRIGQRLDVTTESLATNSRELTNALVDSVHFRLADCLGVESASDAMTDVEPLLRELICSVVRCTRDSAYIRGLDDAAQLLRDHHDGAELPDHAAQAWARARSEIASAIDILRCPDCDRSGERIAHRGRDRGCTHPRIQHYEPEFQPGSTHRSGRPELTVLDGGRHTAPAEPAPPSVPDGGAA